MTLSKMKNQHQRSLKFFWIAPSSPLKGYLLPPLISHLPSTKRKGRSGRLVPQMLGLQWTRAWFSIQSSELFLHFFFMRQAWVDAVGEGFKRHLLLPGHIFSLAIWLIEHVFGFVVKGFCLVFLMLKYCYFPVINPEP